MTLQLGLIGDPVAHSVSPAFQQAAFDALGIDARYEAWRTPANALAERVQSLRAEPTLGANVTVPHKRAVMALLDEVDEAARRTGAVNTIVQHAGRLYGSNTDITGFLDALRLDGGFEPAGARACVLGAGGAARAVVWGLAKAGVACLLVLNRTVARAEALVAELAPEVGRAGLLPVGDEAVDLLAGCDLLVNCTSMGMWHGVSEEQSPLPAGHVPHGAFVADIVANPLITPFMRAAAENGCATLGGLSMLVRQGAASFELWTGRVAPLDVMMQAARRAMQI